MMVNNIKKGTTCLSTDVEIIIFVFKSESVI